MGSIVHPEVRAHITSLASALGGIDDDSDGDYQLGDDALEVLRDIKLWIRFYDERTNRMDVARCIYDVNLIQGDLLPILAKWPGDQLDSTYKSRIVLACFELMVPLTWPLEWDSERMTVNHHRHMPVLELAQIEYKKAIINFDGAPVLHTAARVALPALQVSAADRSARDKALIKLVLYFLRNLAMISPRPNVEYEADESRVSRSALIDAFSYQDIFEFLLMLSSNMGDDFRSEDMVVMEVLYHVLKRVDIERLFMADEQRRKADAGDLSDILRKESLMLNEQRRRGPTRHNRFGTMIWVPRGNGKMASLSGQEALANAATRYRNLDEGKSFKPPRRGGRKKKETVKCEPGQTPKLEARATYQLRAFVQDFLDSSFNPLFHQVRRSIDGEAPHVLQYHRPQFLYLVGWFLEAEQVRRRTNKEARHKDGVSSFNLVATVMSQEMFVTLNKALHETYDNKSWPELCAVMRCFTRILMTVQDMTQSENEEDQEIAENVLSRIFYQEATHELIVNAIKTYKDQGLDYLDAAIELAHYFFRILEAYSKQNADMQIRSRQRTRRRKKAKAAERGSQQHDQDPEQDDGAANDAAEVERVSKERKFDFHRFASRFTCQAIVDTFVAYTKFYEDLNDEQLKRAHRYFYRLAFKQDMSVMLLRVDIIHLLFNMVKGPQSMDKSRPSFKEWEELVKQILRKGFKKIEQRPQIIVEMLFSKLPGTAYFLEYGYEKQTVASSRALKPAAELEFRHTEERHRQIAIVVGAMLDRNEGEHITWLKTILTDAEAQRRSWAVANSEALADDADADAVGAEASAADAFDAAVDADAAHVVDPSSSQVASHDTAAPATPRKPPLINVNPDTAARRTAMFKNGYLRLLMNISGLQRFGPASDETPQSLWVVPDDVSADYLRDSLHFINQAEFSPPTFDEGVLASHQLRRKPAPRKKPDADDEADTDDDDFLFPAGGPTAHDAPDKPKKTRRRRRRRASQDGSEDEELVDERARKRRERELEKARRIKSALYVREGDDEFGEAEDAAFFAREREIADRARRAAESAPAMDAASSAARPKRKSDALGGSSSDTDHVGGDGDGNGNGNGHAHDGDDGNDESNDTQSQEDDTPSQSRSKRRKTSSQDADSEQHSQSDREAAPEPQDAPSTISQRPRIRGGFVIDSDDDD